MRFENQLLQYLYDAYSMFSIQEYVAIFIILYIFIKARAENTILPFKNFKPKHALIAFLATIFGPSIWGILMIILFLLAGLFGGDGPMF